MGILPLLPLAHLSLKEVKESDYFPQPELNDTSHSLPPSLQSLKIHALTGQTAVRSWIADKKLLSPCAITSLTIPSKTFRVNGYNEQLDLSLLPELWSLNLKISPYDSHQDSSWVLWLGNTVRTVDASRFTGGHLKVQVFNGTAEVQYDPLKPEVEQF
ncbi:hypothetical protein BDQ17DRAFT_1425403 [Cyathus striatus]|nr:hypothetical protein BDQ17DRAFT_1425403 [Cyathus striatus]